MHDGCYSQCSAVVEGQRHRMMLHPNYQALEWYCWSGATNRRRGDEPIRCTPIPTPIATEELPRRVSE